MEVLQRLQALEAAAAAAQLPAEHVAQALPAIQLLQQQTQTQQPAQQQPAQQQQNQQQHAPGRAEEEKKHQQRPHAKEQVQETAKAFQLNPSSQTNSEPGVSASSVPGHASSAQLYYVGYVF